MYSFISILSKGITLFHGPILSISEDLGVVATTPNREYKLYVDNLKEMFKKEGHYGWDEAI